MRRYKTNPRKDRRSFSKSARKSKRQNDVGYRLGQRGGVRL